MSFYGIVGFTVWILGSKMGFPVSDRIIIVVLILLTMPFALIIGFVASRRSKKKAAKELEEQQAKLGEQPAAEGQPAAKITAPVGNDDITKSTDEVVQFLKTSNLGEAGKDAVYSLPWYLVAGTPKSGKSSLVIGSNLNFQNLPSQRQSEQKFVRSTRNIDWRVTSDAVFVDTAGRYQTDEGVDGDEWAGLVETLVKYRKTRPVDGFLLIANAEKILNSNDAEVEQMAKVLRARLDDVMTRTKIRFPVYLIFTNADAIEGFRDSFSTSKGEAKNLVWGATIPIEKADNSQALFDGEYELLQDSLMKRRLMRLSAPFPAVRQLRIFNFPLHFGSARRKIGSFVSTLFRPNPFSENPFLRGFYFTASPANQLKAPPGGQTMSNVPQSVGGTYFTERLFRDVLLRDKDLIRTLQEQKQRPPILGWLLTALGALLVLSVLTLAGVSLYNNKQMLNEAGEKGRALIDISRGDNNKNPLEKKADEARKELAATEDLRQLLARLDEYERKGAPVYMRMGFYSGNEIYEKLLPIYFTVTEQRFKKPTVARIEAELKKFAAAPAVVNPNQLKQQEEETLNKNYELLKVYLMMSQKYRSKADAGAIANTLKDFWASDSKLPPELAGEAQQQLEFWSKQWDRQELQSIQVDDNLVKSVREKLKAFPAVNRYYKTKVAEISKQIDEKFGPTSVENLLYRDNTNTLFVEGTYVVPGAYTLEGYKLMQTAISDAGSQLGTDDWVAGEEGKAALAQSTDTGKLKDIYLRDYADHWRNFVRGINVKPYTKENAKDALQSFSSASSPIKLLLAQVALNTNFSAKPVAGSWWDTIKGFWGSSSQPVATGGDTQVEKDFNPLFGFMGEPGKTNAPIDNYQGAIGKVSNKFNGLSIGQINQLEQDLAKEDDRLLPDLRTETQRITPLLGVFGTTSSGQEIAGLLRKPLDNLNILLNHGGQQQLEKTWSEELRPKAKEIEGGFPFADGASDTDLAKLTAFLNPVNGSFKSFYDDRIKKYFDGNPGQLKLKDTSEVKFSDDFVAYLNRMLILREALYGKNAAPGFEYDFILAPTPGAIVEITIDGQKVTSEGSASSKLKFPGGSTETGVFMSLASSSSTTTAPGATTTPKPATTSSPTATTGNTNTSKFLQTNTSTDSSNATIKEPGTWGLFKFINRGNPQKGPSGEYALTYTLGGKKVSITVKPSGADLFDKEFFKSIRAPEKLVK